jgi:hypothetical protein
VRNQLTLPQFFFFLRLWGNRITWNSRDYYEDSLQHSNLAFLRFMFPKCRSRCYLHITLIKQLLIRLHIALDARFLYLRECNISYELKSNPIIWTKRIEILGCTYYRNLYKKQCNKMPDFCLQSKGAILTDVDHEHRPRITTDRNWARLLVCKYYNFVEAYTREIAWSFRNC